MKLAELIKGKQSDIVRIRANSKIAAAADSMTQNRIGALLVEDDAGAVGFGGGEMQMRHFG